MGLPSLLFGFCDDIEISATAGFALSSLTWQEEGDPQIEAFKKARWSPIHSPVVGVKVDAYPFSFKGNESFFACFSIRGEANFLLDSLSNGFSAGYTENRKSIVFHPQHSEKGSVWGSDLSLALCDGGYRCLPILIGYQRQSLHFQKPIGDMESRDLGSEEVRTFHVDQLFYHLKCNSLWVGIEPDYCLNNVWKVFGLFALYAGNYTGEASWKADKVIVDNFRFNYLSKIEQKGVLCGIRANIGMECLLSEEIKFGAKLQGSFFESLKSQADTAIHQTIYSPSGQNLGMALLKGYNNYHLRLCSYSVHFYFGRQF